MKNKFFVLLVLAMVSCSEKNTSHSLGILAAEEPSVIDVMPETYTDIDNQSEPEETWTEEQRVEYFFSKYSHIANETLRKIEALYRAFKWDIWGLDSKLPQEMTNLLLDFLKQEENWSIDVGNELSFMHRSISEDGMVRIYNWEFESATGDTYHTILQYKSELDTINVVQISGWSGDYKQFRQLGFIWGAEYGVGFKIAEQTYLLWAHARAGGFMSLISFVAVRLLDGKLEPYMAFNGDNYLGLLAGEQNGGIIQHHFDLQFNEKPFSIRIFYNPHGISDREPDSFLDFIFNGSEFMGDYNRLNEVANFRRF